MDSRTPFYTLDDLERILKVSRRTLFRRIKDNTLPAFKFGATWRVPASWVQERSGIKDERLRSKQFEVH